MKKKAFVMQVPLAVALCAAGHPGPAAADDVPPATSLPRAAPIAQSYPRGITKYGGLNEHAGSIATIQKAPNVVAQTVALAVPAATPAKRAAPASRSYPRSFYTYDALIEYASSIAATQQESNDRLAAAVTREDASRAALAVVFDPLARAGMLHARDEPMDDATVKSLRTQLESEGATARELIADGAVLPTADEWRLPLVGEDTQDFGPTPYRIEPALTYGGVSYRHFHSGTDIAAAWGTPVVAPASGVVVFAGTMGDGAVVVVISHDLGLVSMYAHLENRVFPLPVRAGDTVEAGDRIGNVGLTGITTGTHLHWGVWRNGDLIDPLSIVGDDGIALIKPKA